MKLQLIPWKQYLLIGALAAGMATSSVLYFKTGQRAAFAESEATSLGGWADVTCALTGFVFRAPDMTRSSWGSACQARVQYLVKFEKDTKDARAKAQQQHATDQAKKAADDLTAARKAAMSAAQAAKRMEKANAAVQDNRVGAEWFGALNELGGLRGPTEAAGPTAP